MFLKTENGAGEGGKQRTRHAKNTVKKKKMKMQRKKKHKKKDGGACEWRVIIARAAQSGGAGDCLVRGGWGPSHCFFICFVLLA